MSFAVQESSPKISVASVIFNKLSPNLVTLALAPKYLFT
jgi:hypothetical protein